MKMKYTKTCPVCGATFETNRDYKKYCSGACKTEMGKRVKRERYATDEAFREHEKARWRARVKRGSSLEKRTCPVCGKTFMQTRSDQVYCSAKCVGQASRERRKLQQAADETMKRERYGTWERRNMAAIVCAPCGKYPTCFECGEEDCNWSRY